MISRMLRDLARGRRLTAGEVQDLYREMVDIEKSISTVKKWLPGGDVDPHIRHLHAASAEFEIIPLEFMAVRRVATQSISNNVTTVVDIDNWTGDTKAFQFDFASNKIIVRQKNQVFIAGTMEWATNSVGRRGAHVDVFDVDGVQLYGRTMVSTLPEPTNISTIPFLTSLTLAGAGIDSMQYTVVQTSGGALDLTDFKCSVWLVK